MTCQEFSALCLIIFEYHNTSVILAVIDAGRAGVWCGRKKMVRWHGCVCSRARTTPPWCCLCAVVLLVLAAPAAAVGQHVPAVFSEMTSQQPPSDGWIDKSQCETHSQCAAGEFCKWTWCGVTLVSLATSLLSRSSRKVSARTPLEQGQARCEQLTSACSV